MNNNITEIKQFNEKRPKGKHQYTTKGINDKISRETKLAVHYLKLFCIKNSLWLVPLIIFLIIACFIDFYIILKIWKNPSILFQQLKSVFWFILAYIAGLYTDELRRKFTKH